MYKILIVEDDRGLNQGIALALGREDTSFLQAFSAREARELWNREKADMALLDVNLPDGSGYDVLREIRGQSRIPVLLITANDLESDEITGFSLGADDYITKPFGLMALRARVDRMRLRAGQAAEQEKDTYEDGRYRFLFGEMRFFVDGQEIVLSRIEQKLLRCFVTHPGQTMTRERLMDILWSDEAQFVEENALSVAVNRLRRKLEGREGYKPIETVYGMGYVWERRA